jgi:ABC-type multidrug transport system ATPase subunit
MMTITLSEAGKRFNRDWIFQNLSYQFLSGTSYALIGPNGSGKSTLLQVISSSMELSSGSVEWKMNGVILDTENVYKYIAMSAPYLEIIEEMTAIEFLSFHSKFKPLSPGLSVKEIISAVELENAAKKQIRFYSSGMKQRIKLAQAIFSDVPLVLLDEPCTNLDVNGYELYYRLIEKFTGNKTVIVSSNDVNEYSFCTQKICVMDFK